MTESFYNSHSGEYFEGRQAVALKDIINHIGVIIREGETVTIMGKRSGFSILSASGVEVSRVGINDIKIVD